MAKSKRSAKEGRRLLEEANSIIQKHEEAIAKAEAQMEVHMRVFEEHGISSTEEAEEMLAKLEKKHVSLSKKADLLLDQVEAKMEEFEEG